jgi:hypothetical protein
MKLTRHRGNHPSPLTHAFDAPPAPAHSGGRRAAARLALAALLFAAAHLAGRPGPVRAAAAAQSNGTVSGLVMNERDEVIPGATVKIESEQLAVSRTATTNGEGYFAVPQLPVGIYNVTADAAGFSTFVQRNVKLDVGGSLNLTLRLRVGAPGEVVNVSDDLYQTVNTQSGNVETLITAAQVTGLALNGRNWVQLVNLAPGASPLFNDAQEGTNFRIDDTAINGLRRRTAPTIDGASNVDHALVATQVNNISVEAIEEFKLVSSPYSAEYGAQAGPAISVVTKRGTTAFHGSLFEFFRHDALNAFTWESKQRTAPEKPLLRFNDFGGFVGGPAYKEKLFFFGGAEFKRPRTGRSLNELVPTAAMRAGNFSAFLPAGLPAGNTSCTPAGVTQTATRFILCDRSVSPAGVAFPGNIIPTDKISPNGLALLRLFPEPNAGPDRFITAPVTVRNIREELLRLDYHPNSRDAIFGRWIRDGFGSDNPLGSSFDPQTLPIAPDNHTRIGKSALFSHTRVFSPSLFNEALLMWQRNDQRINYQNPEQISRAAHGLNFVEIFPANRLDKIPEFTVQGYTRLSGNGLPYVNDHRNWELRDNLTNSRGAHLLKFGGLLVASYKAENFRARDGGILTFNSGAAADSSFRPQDSGHAVANLLLGAFTRYSEASVSTVAPTRYRQIELYVNDQWRAARRLSLTLGLRYQYIPWPSTDLHNVVGFDPQRFDPSRAPASSDITAAGVINLTPDPSGRRGVAAGFYDPYNGIVLPGGGFTPGDASPQASNSNLARLFVGRPGGLASSGAGRWAPRLGFAWDAFGGGRLVIRGGAGIYYDRTLLNGIRDASNNIPFAETAVVTNGRQFATPAALAPGFSNPLDTVGAGGAGVARVQQLTVYALDMPPGVVYAYSLGLQRELPWKAVIDLSYVGNQARHLTRRRDINYVPPEVALRRRADGAFVNPPADTVRPFRGYGAILQEENAGNSSYNSLQASLQKRLSLGLTASAAYTWSKALNDFDDEVADLPVPFDAGLGRGYAAFDRRRVFTMSYVYELPWRASGRGVVGRLAGGWQVSGITALMSGRHVNVTGGGRSPLAPSIGYGGNLDLVGDWRDVPGGQTPTLYVNRNAFAGRAGLIGTVPRNLIEMPSVQNWNLALMKRTALNERWQVQLRAEIFNLFNHPNYRTLVTNFSASNFGSLTETDEPRVIQFGLKLQF